MARSTASCDKMRAAASPENALAVPRKQFRVNWSRIRISASRPNAVCRQCHSSPRTAAASKSPNWFSIMRSTSTPPENHCLGSSVSNQKRMTFSARLALNEAVRTRSCVEAAVDVVLLFTFISWSVRQRITLPAHALLIFEDIGCFDLL